MSRAEETTASAETNSTLFTGDMLAQLHTVFARMASPLVLRLYLDETPLSVELKQYMEDLAAQSSKLTTETGEVGEMEHLPCVRVFRPDGSWTGLAFYGVPGGHEFTSFVLGLYNAAGPGQALDEDTRAAIQSIQKPIKLEILVSLSCTMCPELVTAAQRIAAENPHITAQVYDLNHFPDLREKYIIETVDKLVRKYHTRDPYELCQLLGIKIHYYDLQKKLKGFFFYQSRQKNIVIDNNVNKILERILVAHELGHAVLHTKIAMMRGFQEMEVFDDKSTEENEANFFAAELLLEDEEVLECLSEHAFFETAKMLYVPAALLDYKFSLLYEKGQLVNPMYIRKSDFLKEDLHAYDDIGYDDV